MFFLELLFHIDRVCLHAAAPLPFNFLVHPQAPQAQNTWCMLQLVYIENYMGKSPIVKISSVNDYLI